MTISVSQPLQMIRAKLLNSSDVTSLVSDRVYTSHFLSFDDGSVVTPLIILDNESGSSNYGMGVQENIVFIYVYSKKSTAECATIYQKIYETIHATRLSFVNLNEKGTCYERERGVTGFNDKVKAYYYRSLYVVNTVG